MDKENPKRANGVLTCGNEDIPLDFGPNNSMEKEIGGRKKEKKERKEREKEGRERSSTFSLVFSAIGPSVPIEARRKVLPRGKSFE